MSGFYKCEYPVFSYGDRNSFADFVTKHVRERAGLVARRVQNLTMTKSKDLPRMPMMVDVAVDSARLAAPIKIAFETALVERLGQHAVVRQASTPGSTLRVLVRRVDDPAAVFRVSLHWQTAEEAQWVEL